MRTLDRLLLPLVALFAFSGGCSGIRPTVSGQIVNSMREDLEEPIEGVIASVHRSESPEALVCAISDSKGNFSCKGFSGFPLLMMSDENYRVRFHRDDYNDAVYDFSYHRGGWFSWLDQKRLGQIRLRPHWADALTVSPSSMPSVAK
jgi:hypothetical protein